MKEMQTTINHNYNLGNLDQIIMFITTRCKQATN